MQDYEYSSRDDAKIINAWLAAHHDEVVDAVSFNPDALKATISLVMRQPEFADWDLDRIEDALSQESQPAESLNEIDASEIVGWVGPGESFCPEHMSDEEAEARGFQPLFTSNEGWEDITCDDHSNGIHTLGDARGLGETTMGTSNGIESLIAEAVKKGISSALEESRKPKVKKITRSQLAEGVRKALRMALKENAMNFEMEEQMGDMGSKVSNVQIPSAEELEAALQHHGGFKMKLQGEPYLAFSYALEVAGVGSPNLDTGAGLHAALTALANCPPPHKMPAHVDSEEIKNPRSFLNKTLDSWDMRYGRAGKKIEIAARELASTILDSLKAV